MTDSKVDSVFSSFVRTTLLLFLCVNIEVICCNFDGLIASCRMTVGGIPIEVSARINHCHTPIDVTFVAQSDTTLLQNLKPNNPGDDDDEDDESANEVKNIAKNLTAPISWRYTYVTTNQPESQELPGFGRRVLLHLYASITSRHDFHTGVIAKKLSLKAQFLVDGQTNDGLKFVDETVRIPHFEDCLYTYEGEAVTKIATGCVVGLILLCIIGLLIYWWMKRKGSSEDELTLVTHMERSQSSPKNREPRENGREQIPMDDVYYVVPGQECTTEGEEEEPKVYISTTTGLKKVERKHSQNSDRSSNSGKGSKSNSKSLQKQSEHFETIRSESNLSEPVRTSTGLQETIRTSSNLSDPVRVNTDLSDAIRIQSNLTESIRTNSNLSEPSRTISNLSEPISLGSNFQDAKRSNSNNSDAKRTSSNMSDPLRLNLDSSLSSSSDVSLPPGLSPNSSRSPTSPDRSLGAIPKRRISPDLSETSRSSQRSSSSETSTSPSR